MMGYSKNGCGPLQQGILLLMCFLVFISKATQFKNVIIRERDLNRSRQHNKWKERCTNFLLKLITDQE